MTEPVPSPTDPTTTSVGDEVTTHDEDLDVEQHAGEPMAMEPGVVAEMAALDDDDEELPF